MRQRSRPRREQDGDVAQSGAATRAEDGDAAKIRAALAAHMIVRTRADADTLQARANDPTMKLAALGGGAQLVSTDYERPDPTIGTGYTVRIPGGTPARCNPITAPPGCRSTDVENPALLAVRSP